MTGYEIRAMSLGEIYFDIRCRKEAFDLEHLARLVAREAPAAPALA